MKGSEEAGEDYQKTVRRDLSRGSERGREPSGGKGGGVARDRDRDEEGSRKHHAHNGLSPSPSPSPPPSFLPSLTFEGFCESPEGASLHVAYEASKSALVQNKNTQRQIAAELNRLKTSIDTLQQQQQQQHLLLSAKTHYNGQNAADSTDEIGSHSSSSGGSDDRLNAVEAELLAVKRDYRMSSKELELCKNQVAEIQDLKKIALSALLQAFQAPPCRHPSSI